MFIDFLKVKVTRPSADVRGLQNRAKGLKYFWGKGYLSHRKGLNCDESKGLSSGKWYSDSPKNKEFGQYPGSIEASAMFGTAHLNGNKRPTFEVCGD